MITKEDNRLHVAVVLLTAVLIGIAIIMIDLIATC
jgi:hypothetical protein